MRIDVIEPLRRTRVVLDDNDNGLGCELEFLLHCWRMAHKVDSRQLIYLGRQMGLNIKNQETCELAGELARLMGETKTGAITVALRERLDRERRVRDAPRRLRAMRAIADRCARLLGPGPSAIDHGDVLYDDRGLPA